jgi:protein phosphatase
MREAAREACHSIFDMALEDAGLRGMGTTLTAMLYDSGRMHLVHAGDSRAYLFRDGRLEQLTDDHSWIAEQVRAGQMTEAEARESKFRHIITRSVGFERDVELDNAGVTVEPGDCFLLCSDGLSNYVENPELENILRSTWYRRAPQLLIDLANERGGDDNITVVVVCAANHSE